MAKNSRTLRSRLLGGNQPIDVRLVEALDSCLGENEEVEYRLSTSDNLTHEHEGDQREKGNGGLLFAATDRKVAIVVDTETGRETAEIPYTELKEIKYDSGFLSSNVVMKVWGQGQFRFSPETGDEPEDVVAYLSDVSSTWRVVVAALQDARQYISLMAQKVEAGDMDGAFDARESAAQSLEKAADRTTTGDERIQEPLAERVKDVRNELREKVMRTRAKRGKTLIKEAKRLTDQADYDEAYETLDQAHDHLDRALTIAIEDGYDKSNQIQATMQDLDAQRSELLSRPLELAERARERAQETDSPEKSIAAWKKALQYYRDTLNAGWGTDADFDGDREAVRMQIEWVVANIIHYRKERAANLEVRGDSYRVDDDDRNARKLYEDAQGQLETAKRLAEQHHAGDEADLERRVNQVRSKRHKIS